MNFLAGLTDIPSAPYNSGPMFKNSSLSALLPILAFHFSILTLPARAATLRVLGVRGEVLLQETVDTGSGSIGALTHRTLENALASGRIGEYRGYETGVASVNHLGSASEVLSDIRMNAYGWCYKVDGEISGLLADQYILTGQEKQIDWFYAYARLERDRWTSMCVPANHLPPQE